MSLSWLLTLRTQSYFSSLANLRLFKKSSCPFIAPPLCHCESPPFVIARDEIPRLRFGTGSAISALLVVARGASLVAILVDGGWGLPRPDKSGLAMTKARMTYVVPGFSLMLHSAGASAGLPGCDEGRNKLKCRRDSPQFDMPAYIIQAPGDTQHGSLDAVAGAENYDQSKS